MAAGKHRPQDNPPGLMRCTRNSTVTGHESSAANRIRTWLESDPKAPGLTLAPVIRSGKDSRLKGAKVARVVPVGRVKTPAQPNMLQSLGPLRVLPVGPAQLVKPPPVSRVVPVGIFGGVSQSILPCLGPLIPPAVCSLGFSFSVSLGPQLQNGFFVRSNATISQTTLYSPTQLRHWVIRGLEISCSGSMLTIRCGAP